MFCGLQEVPEWVFFGYMIASKWKKLDSRDSEFLSSSLFILLVVMDLILSSVKLVTKIILTFRVWLPTTEPLSKHGANLMLCRATQPSSALTLSFPTSATPWCCNCLSRSRFLNFKGEAFLISIASFTDDSLRVSGCKIFYHWSSVLQWILFMGILPFLITCPC